MAKLYHRRNLTKSWLKRRQNNLRLQIDEAMEKTMDIGENDASIRLIGLYGWCFWVFPSFEFIHLFFLNAVFVEFFTVRSVMFVALVTAIWHFFVIGWRRGQWGREKITRSWSVLKSTPQLRKTKDGKNWFIPTAKMLYTWC